MKIEQRLQGDSLTPEFQKITVTVEDSDGVTSFIFPRVMGGKIVIEDCRDRTSNWEMQHSQDKNFKLTGTCIATQDSAAIVLESKPT